MKRSRDYHRAQRERMVKRAERQMHISGNDPKYYDDWGAAVRKHAITRQVCSRHCCGNPRRWYDGQEHLTMQERRLTNYKDWYNDTIA